MLGTDSVVPQEMLKWSKHAKQVNCLFEIDSFEHCCLNIV